MSLVLSGCAAQPERAAYPAGPAASAVSVEPGSPPRLIMPTPLVAQSVECRSIVSGSGGYAKAGQTVALDMVIYNGRTGGLIQSTNWTGSDRQLFTIGDHVLPGLAKGLSCARPGEEFVLTVPATEAFGDQGNAQLGVSAGDTLVFYIASRAVYLAQADGVPQLAQAGMPSVVLAPNGQPGISLPKTAPPKSLRIATLKAGNGPVVGDGDTVTLHYTGLVWGNGRVFDSSWTKGTPLQTVVSTGSAANLISGFAKAIIGQHVGSQVLAVIPPDEGYGDAAQSGIPAGSTLVFVIDILGTE